MYFLPKLKSIKNEVGAKKFNKVEKTLGVKLRNIAEFFGVIFGWFLINVLFTLFISRSHSLSLDAYRMMSEGLREIFAQDVAFILAVAFDKGKLEYLITLAMLVAFGIAVVIMLLSENGLDVSDSDVSVFKKQTQSVIKSNVYVVSYKQHVAFLA